jgi:alpha-1,3-mannosyltransferase
VLSQRIHNIFVVGFFNDCFAITAVFCAIALFCSRRWTLGCAVYSFAVSIKMNILLFAPGLLLLLLESQGFMGTVKRLLLCASIQVTITRVAS